MVAVTGAASPLGRRVVDRLAARTQPLAGADAEVSAVLALDTERGTAQHAQWRIGPLDDPSVADRLHGADVVVHLAPAADLGAALAVTSSTRREDVVRRAQAVITSAAAVGARRVVAVTSAMVLGADASNPVPLDDDAPVAALPDSGVVGDLLEVEQVLARASRSHPGLAVTVLRPATVVGDPDEGLDTVVSRHFEAPRLLVLRDDVDNVFQLCHLADLAEAVAVAVVQGIEGALTVGCDGALTQPQIEHLSGMRRVELPPGLAFSTAERLHRVGVLPTPPGDLAYVAYPWAVSSRRLREAGWQPAFDNETCLGLLLEGVRGHHAVASRRLDRKDAALGAAGAAVALMGTAAIVRRRRRRET
ncbi:MAG TPA: NAD-dependent epimerase/dehydratase family protein [Actinomycetales bacterium]|nr:NAD-dependent epimerase/dehydratase family protein [Actinomycetales bacterium]